jgi:hypothetical protein
LCYPNIVNNLNLPTFIFSTSVLQIPYPRGSQTFLAGDP